MSRETNFKAGLLECVKTAGQMIIDNAEDIVGTTPYMSNLNITIEFDQACGSIPEITIARSHLPEFEKLEKIQAIFNGIREATESPKFTAYDKLLVEHPDYINLDGCISGWCPSDFGYLSDPDNCCWGIDCKTCWKREMPAEDKTDKE